MFKYCMKNASLRMVLLCAISALLSGPVYAQSVTESRFVLKDIKDWLPGVYDNQAQIFVESAFGSGEDGNHTWLHTEIKAVEDTGLGEAVFLATTKNRDASGKEDDARLFAFSLDEPMRAVRMTLHQLPRGMSVDDVPGSKLAEAAVLIDADCPVYWRQGAGDIYGTMSGGWCTSKVEDEAVERSTTFRLTKDEFWYTNASKDAASGDWVEGRKDEVPYRFTKVKFYECFISITHVQDDGATTISPFTVHDGGGQYFFETTEAKPRQIEVFLLRSMWTSRSGNNFVPLLRMVVYENGQRGEEDALAGGWSTADSGRIAWFARGIGMARCKIPTPSTSS